MTSIWLCRWREGQRPAQRAAIKSSVEAANSLCDSATKAVKQATEHNIGALTTTVEAASGTKAA